MNDLGVHLLLLAGIGVAICGINAFYAEADDRSALRGLPRRLLVFFAGCGIVAGLTLLLERVFAWVD